MSGAAPPIPPYQTLSTWAQGYVPDAIAYYDGSSGGGLPTFVCLYKKPVPAVGADGLNVVMPSADRVATCAGPQPWGECFWYLSNATYPVSWTTMNVGSLPGLTIVQRPVLPPAIPVPAAPPGTVRSKGVTLPNSTPAEPCAKGSQWNGTRCVKITAPKPGFPSSSPKPTGKLAGPPERTPMTSHLVADGDRTSTIASRYGLSVPALLRANPTRQQVKLTSGETVFASLAAGEAITIPSLGDASAADGSTDTAQTGVPDVSGVTLPPSWMDWFQPTSHKVAAGVGAATLVGLGIALWSKKKKAAPKHAKGGRS